MDADAIVVGAGPTGLMLAAELRLAGARPVVLERRPQLQDIPKANALVGRILHLLQYRGLLERFEAASPAGPGHTATGYPFGNVYLHFTGLAEPPLGMYLPQPQLERLLDERARELGAEIRRGHELTALRQDDASVTADVRGPDGNYPLTARYVVGCDGPRSRVRTLAGIAFSGSDCAEVNRLATATLTEAVTQLDNGDFDVPGVGRVRPGFTSTEHGVFAIARNKLTGLFGIQTTEDDLTDIDDDAPLTVAELQESIGRVLGAALPLGEVTRLSRYQLRARQAQGYSTERIFLAGDAAHQFPATGIGLNVGMLDAVNLGWKLAAGIDGWAPATLLESYHEERHFAGARTMLQTQAQFALRRGHDAAAQALRDVVAELLLDEQPLRRLGALIAGTDIRYPLPNPNHHALTGTFATNLTLHTEHGRTSVAELIHDARPVLLDLANRHDVREAARHWRHRIDIHTTRSDDRPADALLIRPDAHIAWAATNDEPTETAVPALRHALAYWFGAALTG